MLKLIKRSKIIIILILVLIVGVFTFYFYKNYKNNKPDLIIKGTIVDSYEKEEILGMAGDKPYYNKNKYFCLKIEEIIQGVPKNQPVCFVTHGGFEERRYNIGESDMFNLKWYVYDVYNQHYEYYAPLVLGAKN
jgi:hypothetical protein